MLKKLTVSNFISLCLVALIFWLLYNKEVSMDLIEVVPLAILFFTQLIIADFNSITEKYYLNKEIEMKEKNKKSIPNDKKMFKNYINFQFTIYCTCSLLSYTLFTSSKSIILLMSLIFVQFLWGIWIARAVYKRSLGE